jgi:hypothetical protein
MKYDLPTGHSFYTLCAQNTNTYGYEMSPNTHYFHGAFCSQIHKFYQYAGKNEDLKTYNAFIGHSKVTLYIIKKCVNKFSTISTETLISTQDKVFANL